jgi:hypothetical protein
MLWSYESDSKVNVEAKPYLVSRVLVVVDGVVMIVRVLFPCLIITSSIPMVSTLDYGELSIRKVSKTMTRLKDIDLMCTHFCDY